MLTPCSASGVSSACTAPGMLRADITSEVLSLAGRRRLVLAEHQEARGVVRLVLDLARQHAAARSARRPASPAIAAAPVSFARARAASALLTRPAMRSASGRFCAEPAAGTAPGTACANRRA